MKVCLSHSLLCRDALLLVCLDRLAARQLIEWNAQRDKHRESREGDGECKHVLDSDHVRIQYSSKLLAMERLVQTGRSGLQHSSGADLRRGLRQRLEQLILVQRIGGRDEVGTADGLEGCRVVLSGTGTEGEYSKILTKQHAHRSTDIFGLGIGL